MQRVIDTDFLLALLSFNCDGEQRSELYTITFLLNAFS